MKNQIIWLTGQSKAGKTTLANIIRKKIDCIILDGDEMRESISLGAGFSKEDRRQHNLRVARLAKMLSNQTNTVVAVIAPHEDIREEITEICDPVWIYVKKTIPEREGHVYEEPKKYHHVIDNDKPLEESTAHVHKILEIIFKK